jgi:hypothetical protein
VYGVDYTIYENNGSIRIKEGKYSIALVWLLLFFTDYHCYEYWNDSIYRWNDRTVCQRSSNQN